MDIKSIRGKGTIEIDMLIIPNDEGDTVIDTLESLNIDAITDNNSIYVFGTMENDKENNKINIVKRAAVLVEHTRIPRKNFPLDTIIDTRFDYAKSIYKNTFNCDDDIVKHLGNLVVSVSDNELVFINYTYYLNFIDYKSSWGTDYVNLKINVKNILHDITTLLRKSDGEIISEKFRTFPTLNEGERLFIVCLRTGGIMEDPETRNESPFNIVVAESEKEAVSIYDEAYNWDYYHGTCIGEITK